MSNRRSVYLLRENFVSKAEDLLQSEKCSFITSATAVIRAVSKVSYMLRCVASIVKRNITLAEKKRSHFTQLFISFAARGDVLQQYLLW